jgi:hypothetical protein
MHRHSQHDFDIILRFDECCSLVFHVQIQFRLTLWFSCRKLLNCLCCVAELSERTYRCAAAKCSISGLDFGAL